MAKSRGQKSDNKLRIAVIPGDGIGNEVVPEGIRVLEAAGKRFDIAYKWEHFDWSCERFKKKGAMMPADGLDQLRDFDAIYLGAVGYRSPDASRATSTTGSCARTTRANTPRSADACSRGRSRRPPSSRRSSLGAAVTA